MNDNVDSGPPKWHERKVIGDWDATDITVALFVTCIPPAIIGGLVMQYFYPDSSWWVMSAVAFIILMAG